VLRILICGGGGIPIIRALQQGLSANVITSVHPYLGWYGRVGTLWDLAQHYSPGRMILIGEYGGEALDAYATMRDHYPRSFGETPAADADALWGNVQVAKRDRRQLIGFRGRAPTNLGEYILASQIFQADQLTELTRSWRLSPRRVAGYFQFHFMDVLPADWPKSILSHDFTPKRAYLAMAQLNQPVVPLCEIAAKVVVPGCGKTVEELIDSLKNAKAGSSLRSAQDDSVFGSSTDAVARIESAAWDAR